MILLSIRAFVPYHDDNLYLFYLFFYYLGNERGPQLEQGPIVNDFTSYGYDIWNRVTAAASSWSWGGNPNDNSDITISGG